jgi:hypothetical protein
MANRPSSLGQQVEDATFLEKRFGMTPRQASALVAREGTHPDEVREGSERKAHSDPLNGAPEPQSPAEEYTADTDEQRLKPVLHTKNDRVGGG